MTDTAVEKPLESLRTEEEQIARLRGIIADDVRWRNRGGCTEDWPVFDNYYAGKFGDKDSELSPINLYFQHVRGTIPQIYFRNPSVAVGPYLPNGLYRSRIIETLISLMMKRLRFKHQMKMTAHDCWFYGTGFLTHGYDSQGGLAAEDGMPSIRPVSADGKIMEHDTSVIPGMPWSLRTGPRDILVNWGCTDPYDIEHYSIRRLRLVEDVRNDERLDERARKKVKPSCVSDEPYDLRTQDTETDEEPLSRGYVYEYRYFDMRKGMEYCFVDGLNEFLFKEPAPILSILGGPGLTPVVWNPQSNNLWGISDASQLRDLQEDINDANTLREKESRTSLPKWMTQEGFLSEKAMRQLVSEEVRPVIEVDGDVQLGMRELKGSYNGARLSEIEFLDNLARKSSGFSRTRGGEYTPAAKRVTGKEVQAVERGSDLRSFDKRDVLADAVTECARNWIKLIAHFWTTPRMIYAPHICPPATWILFKGTDLKGSYDYSVSVQDLAPDDTDSRKREITGLAQALLSIQDPNVGVDKRAVLMQALAEYPSVDISRILPPSPQDALAHQMVGVLQADGSIQLAQLPSGNMPPAPGGQGAPFQ